jgi:hypothetical protein
MSLIRWATNPILSQPQTTNIYNDYIDSLPRLALGGGCAVGLTYR